MPDQEWMYGDIPYCRESEEVVVGSCLLSQSTLLDVIGALRPDDFMDCDTRRLYEVMLEMHANGEVIDIVTIQEALKIRNLFEPMGGQSYLAQIIERIPTLATTWYHVKVVKEFALRRKMIWAGKAITLMARDARVMASELVSKAELEILNSSQDVKATSFASLKKIGSVVAGKIFDNFSSDVNNNKGFMSNFTDLDSILSGFQPGSL